MKVRIRYRKNPHQKLFHEDDTTRLLHMSGGFGSGKTFGLIMKGLKLHHINRPYAGGLVVPSLPEFKRDVLPEIEEILYKARIPYKYHKTEHYFAFPTISRAKMYVVSAVNKIRGPSWAYALINEVTLIKKIRYQDTVSRVRKKKAKLLQVCSVGTPEGIGSEYYDIFVENPMRGSRVIYGRTDDNAHNLADTYIPNLEAAYDAMMLQAYKDGQFVNMKGNRFYYNYTAKNDDLTITPPDDDEWVHVSMDFNVDPMTAVCWKVYGREMHAFDELIIGEGVGARTEDMIRAMIKSGYTPDRTIIYPDPSGQNRSTKGLPDVQILRDAGYNEIQVRKRHPSFRQRQLNVNNLLEKGLIKVHPKNCPWMKRDLGGVEQDKVTMEKIKENPKMTHTSDGMDYMCDIIYPFSGKRPKTSVRQIR